MNFIKVAKIIIVMAVISFLTVSENRSSDLSGKVPGKFIVKFKEPSKAEFLSKSLSSGNILKRATSAIFKKEIQNSEIFEKYFIFASRDSLITEQQISDMLGADNIESIEPDYYLEFFDYPTDYYFTYQWYLHNEEQLYLGVDRYDGNNNDTLVFKRGTDGVDVGLDLYYSDPPAEHTKVVVAIIDSGVDLVHPELQNQFWKNLDEIPGNGIDDDHNGYVDDTLGFDISGDITSIFYQLQDNDPTDEDGHGTHLAGLVASVADNNGIVGVAPNALIMPVKIRPNGTTAVGAEAIIYAVNAGAKVINISWGTYFVSGILNEALNFARENGVFVAIAAGNSGNSERFYPAAFDSSFVVAAGNSDGYLTDFSTFGSHIDIVAPGQDILSLRAKGTDLYEATEPGLRIIDDDSLYILSDGTSMSAPLVAGAAALLWSIHPGMSLLQIEQSLLLGADDIIDPLNQGDFLPGYDTLSGFGYLNIDNSLALQQDEGLVFLNPVNKNRYTSDVVIKSKPLGGYSGYWKLEYESSAEPDVWKLLNEGVDLPSDSVLYNFNMTDVIGLVKLRLTDKYSNEYKISFYYVHNNYAEMSSPFEGEQLKYNIPITGSAYGPDYDSLVVYKSRNGTLSKLFLSTAEYFNSLIYQWTVSGVETGAYTVYLYGYYSGFTMIDSVHINLESAFAMGWPQNVGSHCALSPVAADLNKDGFKELIIATADGLSVFNYDGTILEGFPVNVGNDMRSVPAIYDIDRDGVDEIIITSDEGIHAYNYDGTTVPGWPQYCYTGSIPFGYGFPNPTITQLGLGEDSAIVIINKRGQVLAYEFNGDSYFYSMQGFFTTFAPRISSFFSFGGRASPFVTSDDFNGDGLYEVFATYSSPQPFTGIGLFDGRTGLPAYDLEDPLVLRASSIDGTTLADFNDDNLLEIVTVYKDSLYVPYLSVKTNLLEDMPGWPIPLIEMAHWIGSYPVVADLDLDGSLEIICVYFEYDIAYLYIFKEDGTPYSQLEGYPYGVAFSDLSTFGLPVVADLTGDKHPEIVFRSGHILPGTGPERVFILDYNIEPVPGWPVTTPATYNNVVSTKYAPVIDDIDNDGLVELILCSDNRDILVWDLDASYDEGKNRSKFLGDKLNSNKYYPTLPPTDVIDFVSVLPDVFVLSQNYPNPFNPATTISFELPKKSHITLELFNILGQKVETISDAVFSAGRHKLEYNGEGLSSGVYLYRLKSDDNVSTKKMVLLK